MKIQNISNNFRFLKSEKLKARLGKIQNHFQNSTEKNSKINYKALFLAGLLTIGSLSSISGCGANKQTSAQMSEIENLDESNENIQTAQKFADALVEKGDELTVESAQEMLIDFFKENSIDNVEIDDVKNPKIKERKEAFKNSDSRAAFWPDLDYDLNPVGGVMYIDLSEKLNDEISRALFVDFLVHETTHVLQSKSDTKKQGYGDLDIELYDAVTINFFMNTTVHQIKELQAAIFSARSGACAKYCKEKMSDSERIETKQNEEKYGTLVSDKTIEIDEEFIKEGVCELIDAYAKENDFYNGGKAFEEKINYFVDLALDKYIELRKPDKSQEQFLKKALLSKIIHQYWEEVQGTISGNLAFKKAMNINENDNVITDFIPETFRLIIEVLEQKMAKEYN